MALSWVKKGNLKGPKGNTGAPGPAGTPGGLDAWQPNTFYAANKYAIAPNGDAVRAKVAFTSGATYDAANWNASTQETRLGTVEGVASQAVGLAVQSLQRWKANTPYSAGQQVVSPDGEVVSAKVAFTSAATYSAANWNPSGLSVTIDFRGLPQRELVSGEDINNIRDPGLYTVPSTVVASNLPNWPAPGFTGSLLVGKAKAGNFTSQDVSALTSSTAPPDQFSRVTRASTNNSWTNWGFKGWARGPMPDGTNLNTFREPGAWTHSNPSLLIGVPAGVTTGEITVEIFVSPKTGTAMERMTTEDGRVFTRTAKALVGWAGIEWKPVGSGGSTPVTVVSDAGLTNALLISDFTQKMGGRRKVTGPTVAFRYDHGLANFNSECRPQHESKNWKYSLALCSAQWDRSENTGITPSMVNDWVLAGLAEIWNHSKDHGSGDGSEAAWKAAILDGLTDLQTQIPAAAGKIFGFAPPGSAGTNFGGFTDGQTLAQFYSPGGQFILSHHPVSAGYLATKRVQDGMVRQGMGHITMDALTLLEVSTYVEQAKAGKTALQIMLHASRLNTPGYMTTATYVSIMDYIKAEETAGHLKVVSPYEQLLCDVV